MQPKSAGEGNEKPQAGHHNALVFEIQLPLLQFPKDLPRFPNSVYSE